MTLKGALIVATLAAMSARETAAHKLPPQASVRSVAKLVEGHENLASRRGWVVMRNEAAVSHSLEASHRGQKAIGRIVRAIAAGNRGQATTAERRVLGRLTPEVRAQQLVKAYEAIAESAGMRPYELEFFERTPEPPQVAKSDERRLIRRVLLDPGLLIPSDPRALRMADVIMRPNTRVTWDFNHIDDDAKQVLKVDRVREP